jgi:putative phosphoesterase
MNIGVVSDTHGCVETWREIYRRYFAACDFIIHAGDVLYHGPRNAIPAEYKPAALAEELNACRQPVVVAAGNCDAAVDGLVLNMPVQAPYAYIFWGGRRIVVNHGHTLDEAGRWATARQLGAAVLVTGHTHVPELAKRDGVILLNPGSPAMSKRPDGHGTVARIAAGKIEIIDIVTDEVIATEEL